MTRLEFWLCVMATTLAAHLASAQSPSATTVLANVQHFYSSANQLTAAFRQTVNNATFNTSKTSDGRLWVLKPSDFRWDYYEKRNGAVALGKSFIVDGTSFWLVDHSNKQIFQSQAQPSAMPAAVSFLTGGTALTSQFAVSVDTDGNFGTKGTVVLKLTPIQPSTQYKRLFFVVDEGDWHVKESIVVDSSGNTNDFKFYMPDLATPVKATLFQVNPAAFPNYKVTQVNQTNSAGNGSGTLAPAAHNAGSAAAPVQTP